MGVDLTFQVQHGHLLLRQLRAQRLRVFQGQVEGQSHQGAAHTADEPGVMQPLQSADDKFNGKRDPDDGFFLLVDLPPVDSQKPGAEQEIKGHSSIRDQHIRPGGIVSLRCHRVGNRQQEIAQLRHSQKEPGRAVQPPGFSRFLLHQYGDILIKQINDQYHAAQEQPVNGVVHKPRYGLQMIHCADGDAVQHQIHQHAYQQCRKSPMQRRMLFLGREVNVGHKSDH